VSFLAYVAAHRAELFQRLAEHVLLVGTSVGLGVLVGVPIGIHLTRHRRFRGAILGVVNVIQTIPSLALFGFLIPIPFIGGIGTRTAIVALFG
jgi:osmoprotectant transport system permease protein